MEQEWTEPSDVSGGVPVVSGRGLAGWLRDWWQRSSIRRPARLSLVERISLGPRQALSLVEADGMRLLIASSNDSAPVFFALGATTPPALDDTTPRSFDATPQTTNGTVSIREAAVHTGARVSRTVDLCSAIPAAGGTQA